MERATVFLPLTSFFNLKELNFQKYLHVDLPDFNVDLYLCAFYSRYKCQHKLYSSYITTEVYLY